MAVAYLIDPFVRPRSKALSDDIMTKEERGVLLTKRISWLQDPLLLTQTVTIADQNA